MLTEPTIEKLQDDAPRRDGRGVDRAARGSEDARVSFDERFGMLVDAEHLARENKRHGARAARGEAADRTRRASRTSTIAPEARARQGARAPARDVPRGSRSHANVIITGATGTGKTYVACALAQQACRNGISAPSTDGCRACFDELALARADGTYTRLLGRLARVDVLVLDDWGLAPLRDQERARPPRDPRGPLRRALDDRDQPAARRDQWHDYLADPTIADALLDRILNNAHRLELKGPSRRKAES